jgi:hypothetical protein
MVESTSQVSSEVKHVTNYDDPVYAKFKNVLKGAQKVLKLFVFNFLE